MAIPVRAPLPLEDYHEKMLQHTFGQVQLVLELSELGNVDGQTPKVRGSLEVEDNQSSQAPTTINMTPNIATKRLMAPTSRYRDRSSYVGFTN